MKLIRILTLLIVLLVLTSMSVLAAPLAWPDQPPDKAFISGPGLKGEVEITDQKTLEALRFGGMEDFEAGVLPEAPKVSGEGYKITRYFYDGGFNFATLHYYPDPAGGRGYVYWEDGPDLVGDHTPYNNQWLYAKSDGEAVLQNQLKTLGASTTGAAALPALGVSSLSLVWLFILVCAVVFASGLIVLRRRAV